VVGRLLDLHDIDSIHDFAGGVCNDRGVIVFASFSATEAMCRIPRMGNTMSALGPPVDSFMNFSRKPPLHTINL